MYAIIQQNITAGVIHFTTVLEICTSFREMAKTMENIRESCHKLGYKGEHFAMDYHNGIVMGCEYTTPADAKYRFLAYEREKNLKWGNFPY